jgi:myo-inositol-1(or 4)-monophosphatase
VTAYRSLLSAAVAAVDVGAEVFRTGAAGTVTAKGDRDMVTELDVAVERAVRGFLERTTPEIGFVAEEEGRTGPDSELYWALDPIDGTANFAIGLPLCAISLGLIDGDRAVAGVIDAPRLGVRYTAAQGEGAYAAGRRLAASGVTELRDAVIALSDFAVGPGAAARNRRKLALEARLAAEIQRIRMIGSAALDLVWTGAGHYAASIMFSNTPWDTSAGVAIAREAGVAVVDLDGTEHTTASGCTISVVPPLRDPLLRLLDEVQRSL